MTKRLLASAAVVLALAASAAEARSETSGACAAFADEAADRSGLPATILLNVMRAESADNPRALSRRGAIGCMQIMPATWRELRARYALGDDPFDPRMNMIGGALYLAELGRTFGFPAAFAAYNAGPERYRRNEATGAPLPSETLAYVARLAGPGPLPVRPQDKPRWQEASLFAGGNSNASSASIGTSVANGNAGAQGEDGRDGKVSGAPGALFPLADRLASAAPDGD